jgi:hypothetical protein
MNYTGKIIVTNKEGIRQQHQWGTVNKLLCEETTGGVDHANFWIHAGYYYGPRDDQPPEYSTCPTSPPGSENAK